MANPRQVPPLRPSVSRYVKFVEPCEDMMLVSWVSREDPVPVQLGCRQPWLTVAPRPGRMDSRREAEHFAWKPFCSPHLQMGTTRSELVKAMFRETVPGLEPHPGAVWVLALITPPPPQPQFFALLFITALGPWPAWLPPAISSYHCSGSQPWALWRQSPLGPSPRGVEGGV